MREERGTAKEKAKSKKPFEVKPSFRGEKLAKLEHATDPRRRRSQEKVFRHLNVESHLSERK